MSKIYEEALKIREQAESAAKERIMESITPQIRQMINNRILFEQEMTDEEDEEEMPVFGAPDVEEDQGMNLDSILDNMPDIDIEDDHEREAAQAASDVAVSVHADGDVNIEIESGDEEDEDDLMVDRALSEAFAKLVKSDFVPDSKLSERIDKLRKQVKNLNSVVSIVKESRLSGNQQERLEMCFMSLVREAVSLQTELKRGGRGSQRLEQKLNSTIKEMREMSSKYKRNIFDFLFEAEENNEGKYTEMKEQDEMEAEAEVEEVEEEADVDVDVDAAEEALMDLGDALGLDLEVAEEGGEGGEEEEEEVEEEEEEELDLDLEEMDHMREEVYEIDESVLRKELSRMRRARRIRESAEEEADQFGGGEVLGDVIEVDEETLINVLADELGSVSESRRRRRPARRPAGNRAARRAMREAAEYKKAARNMKQQLVEMNLFNAKLLYANKLLQNKNLTVKQQRAIVEALDNAKTLREAKLLYKSLSGSLARRGQSGKLSESVNRTLGSSSRSTRSGQPSKSGVETDRWAVLAGIGKN
jgi:hypothetical protein